MFRKKLKRDVGSAYRFPLWKATKGFDETLVIATFRPAAVDGFGVVPGGNRPLYKKWNVLPESQKEAFRLRLSNARIAANQIGRK
jgi:hypothetical protein